MTLSIVIWVNGKCVHDGCPRCSQRRTKNSVLHVLWHFWCAITRKETARWAILWQETRHGCPISHLNQNSSPCTGSILARQKGKSSSRLFQPGRSFCTAFWDRQDVLLVEFLPQGTTINSVVYCETLKKMRRTIRSKRRGMQSANILLLLTITLGRTLLLRLKNSSPHLSGNKWATPRTALIWCQVIITSSYT